MCESVFVGFEPVFANFRATKSDLNCVQLEGVRGKYLVGFDRPNVSRLRTRLLIVIAEKAVFLSTVNLLVRQRKGARLIGRSGDDQRNRKSLLHQGNI